MGPDGVPLDLGRDHRVVTPGLRPDRTEILIGTPP